MYNKRYLSILCLLAVQNAGAHWFENLKAYKPTNRDMIIASAAVALSSGSSFLISRLSHSYRVNKALQAIQKHALEYETIAHHCSIFIRDENLTIEQLKALILQNDSLKASSLEDGIKRIKKMITQIEHLLLELDQFGILFKNDEKVIKKCAKLKQKAKELGIQLQQIIDYYHMHKGYYDLEKLYKEISLVCISELKIGTKPTKSDLLMLAKKSHQGVVSQFPLVLYVTTLTGMRERLSLALAEFERIEKDSHEPLYQSACSLYQLIDSYIGYVIELPNYNKEMIDYQEDQKRHALIAAQKKQADAQMKQAQAAKEQAEAEKKRAEKAKEQVEETRKANQLKEKALVKIDDVQHLTIGLHKNQQTRKDQLSLSKMDQIISLLREISWDLRK